MVNGFPGKIEFCTSELGLRFGFRFLGRERDPPIAYNFASESLTLACKYCQPAAEGVCCRYAAASLVLPLEYSLQAAQTG